MSNQQGDLDPMTIETNADQFTVREAATSWERENAAWQNRHYMEFGMPDRVAIDGKIVPPITKAEEKRQRKQEAIDRIRQLVVPGCTVYTIIDSTSRTNMSANVRVYVFHNGNLDNITHAMADANGYRMKYGHKDSFRLDGLGTDRAHVVAYNAAHIAGIDPYSVRAEYL